MLVISNADGGGAFLSQLDWADASNAEKPPVQALFRNSKTGKSAVVSVDHLRTLLRGRATTEGKKGPYWTLEAGEIYREPPEASVTTAQLSGLLDYTGGTNPQLKTLMACCSAKGAKLKVTLADGKTLVITN
jgi:hypothetical protein